MEIYDDSYSKVQYTNGALYAGGTSSYPVTGTSTIPCPHEWGTFLYPLPSQPICESFTAHFKTLQNDPVKFVPTHTSGRFTHPVIEASFFGCWDSESCGEGEIRYASGMRYVGSWLKLRPHGNGIFYYEDGS